MKWLTIILLSQAIVMAAIGRLAANIYSEVGDAGQVPQLAQDIMPAGPVQAVQGRIENAFDADLFRIEIDDPAGFSAHANPAGTSAPTCNCFYSMTGVGAWWPMTTGFIHRCPRSPWEHCEVIHRARTCLPFRRRIMIRWEYTAKFFPMFPRALASPRNYPALTNCLIGAAISWQRAGVIQSI